MDSKEMSRAVVIKSTQSKVTDEKTLHITAKGREGKALRKKLAIAMGLRVGSSGTPSTVDSEEELEQDNSQNVMETFRNQIEITSNQGKKSSKFNQNKQQVAGEEDSSLLLRHTIRRLQTTQGSCSKYEDENSQERSSDRLQRISSSKSQSQLSHISAGKSIILKRLTSHISTQQTIGQDDKGLGSRPEEEIFSTFGEQNESSSVTQVSSAHSVKHLRDKIRKNTRARKLPRPKPGADAEFFTEKGAEGQQKLARSQIPILSVASKTTEVRTEDAQENSTGKSKIPRRKSHNFVDRKDNSMRSNAKIDNLLSEIFSNENNGKIPVEKIKVEINRETLGNASLTQDLGTELNVKQKLESQPKDRDSTHERFQTDGKSKFAAGIEVTNTAESKAINRTNLDKQSNVDWTLSHHKEVNYDLDAILSELESMKDSLYKTYDDFHEMKEFTLGLKKELKTMRDI